MANSNAGLLQGFASFGKGFLDSYKEENERRDRIQEKKEAAQYRQDQLAVDMRDKGYMRDATGALVPDPQSPKFLEKQAEVQAKKDKLLQDKEQHEAGMFEKGVVKTPEGSFGYTPEKQGMIQAELANKKASTESLQATAQKARVDAANPRRGDAETKAATDLRKEFQSRPITKNYNTIDSSFRTIQALAKNPSPAGDISLITNYMKVLDPNSTVREGEFANAENAGGVPEKIRNTFNKIANGERLTPEQRQDFVNQAKNLHNSATAQLSEVEGEFGDLAKRYGVDSGLIFRQRQQQEQAPQGGGLLKQQPAQGQTSAQTPAVSTQEHSAALDWAKANPNDPRARQIIQLQGGK